ncbi:MAG: glycosyltransferase [Candidatus Gastranaerophilales bacterium]|nr:glycosyltransferase [Candidatus Gastranaerophilales bacterium]
MGNVLAITPISIAGTLIINGLAKGFEKLGYDVLTYDVRDIDVTSVKVFNPDFVIGYDYVHLINPDAERIINELNIPVLHYFADDPNANFAHSGDLTLFNKLAASKGIVFCWDKQYLNVLHNKSYYLPLGVDPDLYSIDKKIDSCIPEIVFVGRPLTDKRISILCEIIKSFPEKLGVYSYKKHFDASVEEIIKRGMLSSDLIEVYKKSYMGFLETEKDLARVYSGSKIVLNITMDQGLSSMNYRVLEVLASEGFLITDFKQDTVDYFVEDSELLFYRSSDELIDKISRYLNEDILRHRIAKNGKEKILQYHTSQQRAAEMLLKLDLN